MAKPSKLKSFNSEKYQLDVKRFLNLKTTHFSNGVTPLSFCKEPHFGRLHLLSLSAGHYPSFMNIGENGDKTWFANFIRSFKLKTVLEEKAHF